MYKRQLLGVQQQAPGSHGRAAIEPVAEDRVADCLQVYAQLVRAAGFRPQCQKGSIVGGVVTQQPVAGQ